MAASSLSPASIQVAGNPKVGSEVWMPGRLTACPAGSMTMCWPGQIRSGPRLHFLDLDDIGVGLELDIIEDAHRRHHESHLDRQRTAQRLDLLGQPIGAVGGVHRWQERIAELDLDVVDLERRGN